MTEQAFIQCVLFLLVLFGVFTSFPMLHFLKLSEVYTLYIGVVALLFAILYLRDDAVVLARVWKNLLPTNLGFTVGLSMAISREKKRGEAITLKEFFPKHPLELVKDDDLFDDEDDPENDEEDDEEGV